jgi:phosphoribosylformimino-5-aminoimidazole carboxamide ribotide isomerase
MKLIPVMDLMSGQVVHARRGERDQYRPIQSILCPSAAPEAILQALIENFQCDTVYLADLDAIRFQRPQLALIEILKRRFPSIQLWLDAGITDQTSFYSLQQHDLATPVIGSESLTEIHWLETLATDAWILSLDFKGFEFLGHSTLAENTAIWPQRILAMNLAQVGSEGGPDLALLNKLRRLAPEAAIYAAGGVRDRDDLIKLRQNGFQGALVATALHNGSNLKVD